MMSSWYQKLYPTRLATSRAAIQELVTTKGGFRMATSVSGVLTGRGADVIIVDDPLKPIDAMSDARRNAANEWYDGTLYSRLNDKAKGAIIIIMQRLHEDDLAGHVLTQEAWDLVPSLLSQRPTRSTASIRCSAAKGSSGEPGSPCTRGASLSKPSNRFARP